MTSGLKRRLPHVASKKCRTLLKILSIGFVSLFVCRQINLYFQVDRVIGNSAVNDKLRLFDADANANADANAEFARHRAASATIHVAFVVCGNVWNESITAIKSLLLFTQTRISLHIVTQANYTPLFANQFASWPRNIRDKFEPVMHPVEFELANVSLVVDSANEDFWRRPKKLCASQRLLFPRRFSALDSIVYLDTDMLLLTPIECVWRLFARFKPTQMAALGANCPDSRCLYKKKYPIPYYGPHGLNSGLVLMNLTRMRQFAFDARVSEYLLRYKHLFRRSDQEVFNIVFHFHPEKLHFLDCSWNYFDAFCDLGPQCAAAQQHGINALHGISNTFHKRSLLVALVYNFFDALDLRANYTRGLTLLLRTLADESSLRRLGPRKCVAMKWIYEKSLAKTLQLSSHCLVK